MTVTSLIVRVSLSEVTERLVTVIAVLVTTNALTVAVLALL